MILFIHLTPYLFSFIHPLFPSHHNMTLSQNPRGHMHLNASYDLTENWIQRTLKAIVLFMLRIMGLMSQVELILCTQSFHFVLKRGWAFAVVLRRRGNSHLCFSQILHTYRQMGRFFGLWCTRGPSSLPLTSTSKNPCVHKHMRSFPLKRNIFLS